MKDRLAFFRGRVEVEARGNQTEQLINLLHRRGMILYRLRRKEEGVLNFSVTYRDFKRMREAVFKTGTRIRILKKRGFYILLRPFKRRWGLAVGLALFLGLVFYSSQFIWRIEVRGCEETSVTQILNELEELGVRIGTRRTVDVNAVENRYLTGNDKLSWMSINIRGTTAFVEVKEKARTPARIDSSVPTNIYAARDGVILSVMDYSGTRMIEVGEAVSAGDLLVSGDWTDRYGVRRLSHCIASVRAETQRETEVSVAFKEKIREKTGKKRKKYAISFGKFKIPLYFTEKISYNEYDIVEKSVPLRIGTFAFPVTVHVTRVEEVRLRTVTRTRQQAKAEALVRLGFYEEDLLNHTVIRKRQLTESVGDESLSLHALYYCEEEIGIALPIEE